VVAFLDFAILSSSFSPVSQVKDWKHNHGLREYTMQSEVKERSERLKSLLAERSHEEGLVVAVRSSMRALPVFWNWAYLSDEAKAWEIPALPATWANLSAWLVAVRPSEKNKTAAQRASNYCDSTASDLSSKTEDRDDFGAPSAASAAAFSAAHAGEVYFPNPKSIPHLSILYASSCRGAGARKSNVEFLDAALRDCASIDRGTATLSESLWLGERNVVADEWKALSARLARPKGSFFGRLFGGSRGNKGQSINVWWDWYQRALDGSGQPHLEELEALSWSIGKL
jgi:hypothetical protein